MLEINRWKQEPMMTILRINKVILAVSVLCVVFLVADMASKTTLFQAWREFDILPPYSHTKIVQAEERTKSLEYRAEMFKTLHSDSPGVVKKEKEKADKAKSILRSIKQ